MSSPPTLAERPDTMPPKEITAELVIPPPMSTTILPVGSWTGSPTPMAAATGSSMRNAALAPASIVASITARRSTSVTYAGTETITRGLTIILPLQPRTIRWRRRCFVMSKLAITPCFRGRTARIAPGVLPIILFASSPTAITSFDISSIATTEGSIITTPRPATYAREFAVPRSIAISLTNNPCLLRATPFYSFVVYYLSTDLLFHNQLYFRCVLRFDLLRFLLLRFLFFLLRWDFSSHKIPPNSTQDSR